MVKPRFQRAEQRGYSLHHFHGYAVKDRVDLSATSDDKPPYTVPEPSKFLPSIQDVSLLKQELGILVSR